MLSLLAVAIIAKSTSTCVTGTALNMQDIHHVVNACYVNTIICWNGSGEVNRNIYGGLPNVDIIIFIESFSENGLFTEIILKQRAIRILIGEKVSDNREQCTSKMKLKCLWRSFMSRKNEWNGRWLIEFLSGEWKHWKINSNCRTKGFPELQLMVS